jgi:6-phosphogluconolactonase (cycloisomerase 2 family)
VNPTFITVNPSNTLLFVSLASSVAVYAIDSVNGTLTLYTTLTGFSNPNRILTTSSGNFLYILDDNTDDSIVAFIISATGIVANGSTAVSTPGYGAISPSDVFLFSCSVSLNEIQVLTIQPNGTTVLTSTTAVAGSGALRETITSIDGSNLYISDVISGRIYQFSISFVTGAVTALAPAFVAMNGGVNPLSIDVSSDGSFLFASSTAGNVIQTFSISTTGQLTWLSSVTATSPDYILYNNGFIYACSNTSAMYQWYVVPSTGVLVPLAPNSVATASSQTSIVGIR